MSIAANQIDNQSLRPGHEAVESLATCCFAFVGTLVFSYCWTESIVAVITVAAGLAFIASALACCTNVLLAAILQCRCSCSQKKEAERS